MMCLCVSVCMCIHALWEARDIRFSGARIIKAAVMRVLRIELGSSRTVHARKCWASLLSRFLCFFKWRYNLQNENIQILMYLNSDSYTFQCEHYTKHHTSITQKVPKIHFLAHFPTQIIIFWLLMPQWILLFTDFYKWNHKALWSIDIVTKAQEVLQLENL